MWEKQLASQIVLWEQKLVFIPKGARSIWISDLELQNWKRIGYEDESKGFFTEYVSFQAFLYGEKLFIVGADYPAIMCLEKNGKLTYIREPYQRLVPRLSSMREFFFRKGYVLKKNYVYLASCRDNFVLKLCLDTYEYEWLEIGSKGNRYSGITSDEKYFWLSPRPNSSPIVKWDGANKIEEFDLPDGVKTQGRPFQGIFTMKNGIFLPGFEQKYSIFIPEHGKMKTVEGQYFCYRQLENKDYIVQHTDGILKRISADGNEQTITYTVNRAGFWKLLGQKEKNFRIEFGSMRQENEIIQLNEMIRMIVEHTAHILPLSSENCGGIIWSALREKR